jgi:predicted MPP superfamily phosphohydrolase
MAMLTFLSVALLIYGSMHLYALGKVWLAFPHSYGLALALILAGTVLTFSPLLVHFLERQSWHRATVAAAWVSYTWMGYLLLFFCLGLLFDLGHALAALLHFKWPLTAAIEFRSVGLLALAALGYGFVEARQLRVEEIDITTAKLASGRVTIAQISDLHLGIMQGNGLLDHVIAQLRELKPDIVVATGDIIDGEGDDLDALARHFQSYTPPLGAYAVTGNHEYYAGLENSLRFLHNAGFTVLRGESAKAGGIVLAGVDDSTATNTGQQATVDTRKALASVGASDYIVLLKHQPVVDDSTPFDLQLSGHIHGGQIFPFVYLTRLTYRVHTGLTELAGGRKLYVSRGAGTWGPPVRLFATPEITLITITSANK